MTLGIKLDRIDPGEPQQNGSHERMHPDKKNEMENKVEGDILAHRKKFDCWRKEFNNERPHEALGMRSPAMVDTESEDQYDGIIADLEYPDSISLNPTSSRISVSGINI